ncbi:hypothetical protein AB0912_15450 [Streptomyces sp. NPDC007084]|uniref:hypothetical protein n=1 Tax=Streptomyces sp. NPDC007084 TaxID=3154313 RepID=UPI0034521645
MAGGTPHDQLSPAQIRVIAAYARGFRTAQVCAVLDMSWQWGHLPTRRPAQPQPAEPAVEQAHLLHASGATS